MGCVTSKCMADIMHYSQQSKRIGLERSRIASRHKLVNSAERLLLSIRRSSDTGEPSELAVDTFYRQ